MKKEFLWIVLFVVIVSATIGMQFTAVEGKIMNIADDSGDNGGSVDWGSFSDPSSVFFCSNTCPVEGAKQCNGNELLTCTSVQPDCREWVKTTCPGGCWNGECKTYCGDGIVQRPNQNSQVEDCDDKLPYCVNCVAFGTPDGMLQSCSGSGVNVCSDKLVNPIQYFGLHPLCRNIGSCYYPQRDVFNCNNNYCPREQNTCYEPDGGKNYYQKSMVSSLNNGVKANLIDSCVINVSSPYSFVLTEGYCDGTVIKTETHTCNTGETCYDGACIIDTCTDSDGLDFSTGGHTFGFRGEAYDFLDRCESNTILAEYYCSNNIAVKKKIDCNDCYSGACH